MRVEVFVQGEGVGILEAAEHFAGRLVEHGPELDGWLVERTAGGIHHQLQLRWTDTPVENRYETLTELQDAAVATGLPCTVWSVIDDIPGVEIGACAEGTKFSVHENDDSHARALLALRQQQREQAAADLLPEPIVAGDNWIVPGTNADLVADTLGGSLL